VDDIGYILSSVLGEPIGPELVEASSKITALQVSELKERLTYWGLAYSLPAKSPLELRPFASPLTDAMITHLDVGNPMIPFAAVDELKQYLLYAHSVAVPEPISCNLGQPLGTIRNFLPFAVSAVVDVSPLLKDRVIHLIPYYKPPTEMFIELFVPILGKDSKPTKSYERLADRLIENLDLSDYPLHLCAFADSSGVSGTDTKEFRSTLYHHAFRNILETATIRSTSMAE
jgi:hypothetical protein